MVRQVFVLALVAGMLAGCSAASSPTPTPTQASPTASGAPASSGTPAPSAVSVDTTAIIFGYTSNVSMSYVPQLVAVDAIKAAGYKITMTQFSSNDLGFAALATNALQLWASTPIEWSNVIAQAPLKIIDARNNNEWVLISTVDITNCAQLTGKKVGYFNMTGVSTAYPIAYFKKNCPDVKPDIVLIPDSGLRAQAMGAGQLVATPLALSDAVSLLAQYPGKFHTLANFAADLPDVGRSFAGTNTSTLNDHETILEAYIKAHLLAIRSFYADPTKALAAANQYLPADPNMQLVVKAYLDNGLFCANGGLQDSNLSSSLQYFASFGLVTGPTNAGIYMAPGPLLNVLKDIGPSTATKC